MHWLKLLKMLRILLVGRHLYLGDGSQHPVQQLFDRFLYIVVDLQTSNSAMQWLKLLKMLRILLLGRQLYLRDGFPTPSSAMIWLK